MPDKTDVLDAHILIVDDTGPNVLLLEQLLHSLGYRQVRSTQNPFEVCELHRTHCFDLILLDLQMPGMDGFAVLEALAPIEEEGYVPVLAITVQPSHKLRALAAGAKDFVAKPFELDELSTRIHNLLEVRLLYKKLADAVNALESFALHDALTGLANRRLLTDRLNQSRLSSARTHNHGALMFLDIDHFKQLNDTLGHDAGDLLLQEVSQRLLSCVREGDCVARFGGDEFVVLLDVLGQSEADAVHQTDTVAQKILLALQPSFDLQGHNYETSLSIGAVVFLGVHEPVADLLKKADRAMYRAKSLGRNQLCFFDPAMQAAVLAQEALVRDLRHGLAANEFVLHCQIQLDAQGVALGAEALLRWRHGEQGLLLPGQFIGLAEETGLILPLGHWVLEAACRQLLLWAQDPQTAHWTLAVNIGAIQLAQADFAASVALALQNTGAPANKLILELTEDTLATDVADTVPKMNAIRALGVSFCLDDFGAGLASLAYLKRMPLAQIKVDRALVHRVLSDDSVAVIARAITALGASLGLPVVAEGVESAAQRDFFLAIGCSAFQGHHIGTVALPDEMFVAYMKNKPPALVGKGQIAITRGANL
jgi:diguanylate cyclase (GGDEF)-like protein